MSSTVKFKLAYRMKPSITMILFLGLFFFFHLKAFMDKNFTRKVLMN